MAPKTQRPARLIALDGSRGADIAKSAEQLAVELRERGVTCLISQWDASGLFGELAQTDQRATASVRTLSLVYAADLAFRLRWEIGAALERRGRDCGAVCRNRHRVRRRLRPARTVAARAAAVCAGGRSVRTRSRTQAGPRVEAAA